MESTSFMFHGDHKVSWSPQRFMFHEAHKVSCFMEPTTFHVLWSPQGFMQPSRFHVSWSPQGFMFHAAHKVSCFAKPSRFHVFINSLVPVFPGSSLPPTGFPFHRIIALDNWIIYDMSHHQSIVIGVSSVSPLL